MVNDGIFVNKTWLLLTRVSAVLLFLSVAYLARCSGSQSAEKPPVWPKGSQVDTIQGVVVHDPYRGLEDWNNPKVRQWSNEENTYARQFLDKLPNRSEIEKRIADILDEKIVSYSTLSWRDGSLFAIKSQPPLNQPFLVVMESAESAQTERMVVDPNKIDSTGETSIDWYKPSPDGKLVAVSLSHGGSESGDLHFYQTSDGEQVDGVIERVNGGTAGGDLAWLPDGSGVYYTRYPREGERPAEDLGFYQEVWFHKMGTPLSDDTYIIGKEFSRISETRLQVDAASGTLLISVQYGDSGRFMHFLKQGNGSPKQITTYEDGIIWAAFGSDKNIFLLSVKDAPRGKILKLSLSDPVVRHAKTVVPQGDNAIMTDFWASPNPVVTPHLLYVPYQLGGPMDIRVFDYNGMAKASPRLLPVSRVSQIVAMANDRVLFNNSSYVNPPAWYAYDPASGQTTETALAEKAPVDFSNIDVHRVFATSKDGTQVPITILYRKGTKLDGNNPVLLYGYGGFGVSVMPSYKAINTVWLDQGGIYATANIRGGGEFGEVWHHAGSLTNKQNVFDDFTGTMEYMIKNNYTNPNRLAIIGGSNGGLLMGAIITQHPLLFKAAVSSVGLYDMIRSELTTNGAFNIPEYGSVQNPEQFRALYAYSPYHHVKDSVAYPAVLFMTGANDPRVNPMHSRKMTAALQAATISKNPILLRTSSGTGHGFGTPLDEYIRQQVDIYSFLFHELNMKFTPAS